MRHKKQATRLLCQLSPSSEDRERERAERSQREGREKTESRQREGKEKQSYARGKEATNQREREPQKSFRCERRNARFALVDAQEAAAIEQIACLQAASRQPSDKQPLLPPAPPCSSLSTLYSCLCGRVLWACATDICAVCSVCRYRQGEISDV